MFSFIIAILTNGFYEVLAAEVYEQPLVEGVKDTDTSIRYTCLLYYQKKT